MWAIYDEEEGNIENYSAFIPFDEKNKFYQDVIENYNQICLEAILDLFADTTNEYVWNIPTHQKKAEQQMKKDPVYIEGITKIQNFIEEKDSATIIIPTLEEGYFLILFVIKKD